MGKKLFKKHLTPLVIGLSILLIGTTGVSADVTDESLGYSDVTEENAHYGAIMALTEQGIIQGYENNEFRPWENLTRQHAAVILSQVADFEMPEDIAKTLEQYNDVASDSRYAEQIAILTEAGVFKGDEDGNFNPQENITRQQMATVLVLAFDLEERFGDMENVEVNLDNVTESHKERVQIIANLGLTVALEDFRPKEDISRGAFSTLVHNTQSAGHVDLSIMHMNDTHAEVEPLPKMLTAIKEVRAEKPESLLFHTGDVFSGTLYFNEFKGQADLALFNMMDFTAMTFGNHEFDLGDKEEGNKSLSEFVKAANFPFLGSNIDFREDPFMNELAVDESLVMNAESGKSYYSIIEEIDGEQIGIFGLNTEATENIARPNAVTFNDYLSTAKNAVAEFEEAGIDKIIALSHLGYDNNPVYGNDLLLSQVEGIDVIVGGHSHTALEEPVSVMEDAHGDEKDPTLIVQAGDKSRYLGTLDVEFDEDGVIVNYSGELLQVDNYEADEEAMKVWADYSERVDEVKSEQIGAEALEDIVNSGTGERETPIGNLITDAMLVKSQEKFPETVIAFQNGGGIRATIEKGEITAGDVISVLPFGNDPVVGLLTGEEIKETLEHSVHLAPEYHGGFLSVSGMTFKYDSSRDIGERVIEMKALIDGDYVDINLDEEYMVTTNEFTAQGGDGFETLAQIHEEGRFEDIGEIDWEQLRDYLVENLQGVVDPQIEGRIIDIASQN